MNWFLAGWVLVLQTVFWGLGLTLLILPRRWRRFWPGFVGPVGLALQSAVVWAGAHTALPGTDSYGFAALALPVGLLAGAGWRLGWWRVGKTLAAARGWSVLLPIVSLSLALQIAPFTKPPALLTSQSLGSCDAADYAAGARVLKEFSSRDRSGFIGEKEVVRVLQVDNFFDFWLRLNHFTPSALLALDSTLLRRQPYELTSLLGVVLVLLNLPLVFFLARAAFRFRPWAAGVLTTIYAVSPILFYAVYQVALGQLIAAPAVGLILWSCLQADRAFVGGQSARRRWAHAGLLLAGNSLLLSAYNFFILFAYVPVVAYVGGRALLRRGPWRAGWQMAGFVGASLLVCTLLLPERVISLGERLFLFQKTAFGWSIAPFRPDGWYGVFGSVRLAPAAGGLLALGLVGIAAAGVAGWALARRGEGRTAGLALACTLPILCGYGILSWQDLAGIRVNASYDAYKLFSGFYPGLLLGLCLFLRVERTRVPLRAGALVLAGAILWLNLAVAWRYNAVVRRSDLVDRSLGDLAAVESLPGVDGINLCVQTYWDRIWANQFLLHKRQYFSVDTYEGRRATALHGDWDLCDRYLSIDVPAGEDLLKDNAEFSLLDRRGASYLDVRLGSGWYEPERDRGSHWCWSAGGAATVTVLNPHAGAVDARLRVRGNALQERKLRLSVGDALAWEGQVPHEPEPLFDIALHLPPGTTTLRFETPGEPGHVPGDKRPFGFAVYGLQIQPVRPSAQP